VREAYAGAQPDEEVAFARETVLTRQWRRRFGDSALSSHSEGAR
jgi:hypothetical protein